MQIKALNINSVGDYGIKSTDKRYTYKDKNGNDILLLDDDEKADKIFNNNIITQIVDKSIEMKVLYDVGIRTVKNIREKIKKDLSSLIKKISCYNSKDADVIIREFHRGRLTFKNLSDLLYLHQFVPSEFTQKIVDYIRENNITVITYKRPYSEDLFCLFANGDDKANLNFDVLKYTIDKKHNEKNDNVLHIKNYTHGTWADIIDLQRSGRYNNRQEYWHDLSNREQKTFKPNYRAWMNSKNLEIGFDEDENQKNDICVFNSNHPHYNIVPVPSINGMVDRGKKSSIVFNKMLSTIDDYLKEKEYSKIKKDIIFSGVSNGNIHMLKSLKHVDSNNLDDNDNINIHLESIPHYGIFTADPFVDTSQFFVDAILSRGDIYDKVKKIKIETNLSKKFHPYSAVYDFLKGVYEYYIYDDNIPMEQMQEFHDKLIIQNQLKYKSENIYKEALIRKQKRCSMTEDEKRKEVELKSIVLFIYILLCLTIIGVCLYFVMRDWQKERDDKRYLNKIYVNKKKHNKNNKMIIDNNNNLNYYNSHGKSLYKY